MLCLLAVSPTTLPSLVKAMMEGVVLEPSEFSMTFGMVPSMIATQELVVPKSMPTTGPVLTDDTTVPNRHNTLRIITIL
jgi:hypothetical protein